MIKFSPVRFLHDWMAMIPADDPRVDRSAFVQAMADVVSDEEWAETTSARVDAVGEFLLELGSEPVRELFAEIVQSSAFLGAAQAAAWAFDPAAGLDGADPGVRALRRDALRDLVESLSEPFEAYLVRRRATRNREIRRLARRQPVLSDLVSDGDEVSEYSLLLPRSSEPDAPTALCARECAQRVVRALDDKVPARVRRALARFLAGVDDRPAYEVAREEGTSAASLTRAKQVLGGLARAEIEDLPAHALPTFCAFLTSELCRVA